MEQEMINETELVFVIRCTDCPNIFVGEQRQSDVDVARLAIEAGWKIDARAMALCPTSPEMTEYEMTHEH